MPKMQGGLTTDGKKLDKFLKAANGAHLEVGFLGGVQYQNGKQVGNVARDNEYGILSKQQPPRSFMRPAIEEIKGTARETMASLSVAALDGSMSFDDVFTNLGLYSQGVVVKSIESVTSPELSPRTIAARRKKGNMSQKPLEDSLLMKESVDFKVSNDKQ